MRSPHLPTEQGKDNDPEQRDHQIDCNTRYPIHGLSRSQSFNVFTISGLGWAKAHLGRAHQFICGMVGTLRFAHPTSLTTGKIVIEIEAEG
jgi:hypothetical protein